jgi:hypothetical protein
MAQILGAIVGTFLFSRIFWVATRAWPNSEWKAIVINVVCAAILIPCDYLVRENVPIGQEIMLYGGCQALVFIYNLFQILRSARDRSA